MLGDLLPDGALLMTAGVDRDVLVLADAMADRGAETAVQCLKKEFKRFEQAPMLSAASRVGTLEELPLLFRQVQELLGLNMDAGAEGLLRPGRTAFLPETVGEVFDFDALRQAAGYEALVQELALAFLKMEAKGFGLRQQQQLCALAWKLLFADKPAPSATLAGWAGALTAAWGLPCPDKRSREIFLAIYENLGDPDFSLQRIAQERLYVSEDHLRRVFSQLTGRRFSVYLEQCRIRLACRLLEYQPDMKISRLAELVGYPLDGQYFSKVFRKVCGVTGHIQGNLALRVCEPLCGECAVQRQILSPGGSRAKRVQWTKQRRCGWRSAPVFASAHCGAPRKSAKHKRARGKEFLSRVCGQKWVPPGACRVATRWDAGFFQKKDRLFPFCF